MPETPLVSIIVRARDEEPALRRLLPLLQGQRADFQFEIWLLDNASRDGSAQLAQAAGICYHFIPRGAYNYATALNLGASLARGEIVVNLSAHCFPEGDGWLAALVAPLRDDPAVVATYGRQWANPRVAPFEALGNDQLFPPPGRSPELVAFSNANSAVRRAHLLLHPFNPAVKILEDHLFYLELAPEERVAYVAEALVHHEHEAFSWRYYMRRWLREGWSFFFIARHRGHASRFAGRPLIAWRDLLLSYPHVAGAFAKKGRVRMALLTLPFFYLRDLSWAAGMIWARLCYRRMAREDVTLLLRANQELRRALRESGNRRTPEP
jgi:glycosyltransferase involved in cell wall biosynthesis